MKWHLWIKHRIAWNQGFQVCHSCMSSWTAWSVIMPLEIIYGTNILLPSLLLTSSNMQLESVFVLLLISSPHTASGRFSRKWKCINTEQFMLFSQTYLALALPSDIFQTFCSWFLSENLVMVVNFLMSQSKKKKPHCSCFKPTEIKAVSCYGQSVCTSVAVTVCSVQCLASPAVHTSPPVLTHPISSVDPYWAVWE